MPPKSKKFTFSYFKKIKNLTDINAYIDARLPLLGTGSSRKVYGYGSGKVIKVAINQNGLMQNAAELETYTNPKTKKIVAKIYSYGANADDTSKVNWLLSEGAQPIKTKNTFRVLSGGIDWDIYQELVSMHGKCLMHPELHPITSGAIEADLQEQYDKRAKYFAFIGDVASADLYEKQKKNLEILLKADLYSGVVQCMQSSHLMPGDILEIDHYGKTVDGKLVLIDYGFTKEVADAMFPEEMMENNPITIKSLDGCTIKKTILPPPGKPQVPFIKTKKLPRMSETPKKKEAV